MNLYAIFYKPGPSWQHTVEIWDQNLIEHGEYMASLKNQGKLMPIDRNYCEEHEKAQPIIEIRKSTAGFYIYGIPLSGQ